MLRGCGGAVGDDGVGDVAVGAEGEAVTTARAGLLRVECPFPENLRSMVKVVGQGFRRRLPVAGERR